MADQNTLEILDCVVEDNDSTVYRALYNGKPRCVRIWKTVPDDSELQRLQYVQSTQDEFPQPYQLINIQGHCGLLMQSMSGVSITSLQSSLSPKMVYEILAQVCAALHRSHITISSVDGIFISPQGNIFMYTPCLESERSSFDSVWLLGWWALQKLSPTDDLSAYTLIQGNEREYTVHLKQTLRNIESGLPNPQWIASVIQSFENICAFHSENRWNAENTTRMMNAYTEQAIGLDIGQFCRQHRRIFESVQYAKGHLSGQVHPCTEWNPPKRPTMSTSIHKTLSFSANRQYFLLSTAVVFFGLHSITAAAMWLRPDPTPASTEELVQVTIEHTGIRKLTLENGLTAGTKIALSRSKRNTSTTIPKGRYKLTVKHMHALKSAFIRINTDTSIMCEHKNNSVECNQNNRPIKLK